MEPIKRKNGIPDIPPPKIKRKPLLERLKAKGYDEDKIDYISKKRKGAKIYFNSAMACYYDQTAAVLFNYFVYWIELNKENNTNYRDGYYWTFNSVSNLRRRYFPFYSERCIRLGIEKLCKDKILIKASKNYNKHGYDKTTWYRVSDFQVKYIFGFSPKQLLNSSDDED